MKKIVLILILIVSSVSAETFKDLQEIPRDSINAETMKIWVPVESDVCEVTVKILDKDNNVVRKLMDRRVRQGYYNIFWDKKDDSGKYVVPGEYNIAIISCSYRKISQIDVAYQAGENIVYFKLDTAVNPPGLVCIFLDDSKNVSIEVLNSRQFHVSELVSDTAFGVNAKPRFSWTPEKKLPTGDYIYKVTVDGFSHYIDFYYKRMSR